MMKRRWRETLTIVSIVGLVVIGVVMTNMGYSDNDVWGSTEATIPEMHLYLNGVNLVDIDGGNKETKYFGNSLILIDKDKKTFFEDVEIKGRGNSTWVGSKKPYRIKFTNKVNFLGMGNERKWILLANSFDASSLRNDVAFYIARTINDKYPIDGRFAELYVNDGYVGLYYVTETVSVGKDVVNLVNPLGILMELDNNFYKEESCYYVTAGGNHLVVKDMVDEHNLDIAVTDFIINFNQLELAAKKGDFMRVTEFVDIRSFAEYYLLSEFIGNFDAYITSHYFYKDGLDDKIHAGPGWDFDATFGNIDWTYIVNDGTIYSPEMIEVRRKEIFNSNSEMGKLMYYLSDMPKFQKLVGEIYREKMAKNRGEILGYIEMQANYIREAAILNNEVWDRRDFDESVGYLLDWVEKRFDVFDEIYNFELMMPSGLI